MKQLLILMLIIACPLSASAQSFLCKATKGAVVADNGEKPTRSGEADVSQVQYILSNDTGKWELHKKGSTTLFDQCDTPFFCESSAGFAGFFSRNESGLFSVVWFTGDNSKKYRNQLASAKGLCEEI